MRRAECTAWCRRRVTCSAGATGASMTRSCSTTCRTASNRPRASPCRRSARSSRGSRPSRWRPPPSADFERWWSSLEEKGVFLRDSVDRLHDALLERLRTIQVGWTLTYGDAAPKNFVTTASGGVLSIDEKSLAVAPPGFSLIQPLCNLSGPDFVRLARGYWQHAGRAPRTDPAYREFLIFYWCLSTLGQKASLFLPADLRRKRELYPRRRALLKMARAGVLRQRWEGLRWKPWEVQCHLRSRALAARRFAL